MGTYPSLTNNLKKRYVHIYNFQQTTHNENGCCGEVSSFLKQWKLLV